jgi:photosystem II stability/assembly factor-like uncharacterized protein
MVLGGLLGLSSFSLLAGPSTSLRDPLEVPAAQSALAARSLIQGLARAGDRVVAVGQRGHILYSDDQGLSWQQALVPLSSDLLAVHFPSATQGWAVGHDGVVLHTTDAGRSWQIQLTGQGIATLLRAAYTPARVAALGLSAAEANALQADAERLAAQGAENPLLAVWFADERTGFAVGAFNLIFKTADGGKTWEPWFHRTVNPQRLHFYAIAAGPQGLLLAGEQGVMLRLDDKTQRFLPYDTGYRGSFFGLQAVGASTYAFGLRGHLYRVGPGVGWTRVDSGLADGLVAAAACPAGGWLLASQSGRVVVNLGEANRPAQQLSPGVPVSAVLCLADGQPLIAGAAGLRKVALP